MAKPERSLKLLLTLLVIGVWGLLISYLFTPFTAQAQANREYAVVGVNDNGQIITNGGYIDLNADGLIGVLEAISNSSWRVHSVYSIGSGHTVIIER